MKLALLLLLLPVQTDTYDAFGKTIPELQEAMRAGDVTSVELVRQYLARIEAFDQRGPKLNSMTYVNPGALEDAAELDRERQARGSRGPLHGIPVILKDNYDTFDMPTTAGSIALAGYVPRTDGYQVQKLREAGAVFVGKSNMHELAYGYNTVSSMSGQTLNPYDPARIPGGSSGGTGAAIAAEFAAIGMGSDTCGSIRVPAATNNLFGLRVTQGLSSRAGIVPLALTQDVGGPIARSVTGLALVLDATVGFDPRDPQTAESAGHVPETYTTFLRDDALSGVRLGMFTSYLVEEGQEAEMTRVVREAAALMAEHGAELVDIDIDVSDLSDARFVEIDFKPNLAEYLAKAEGVSVRSLEEIVASGLYHKEVGRLRGPAEFEGGPEIRSERLAKRAELRRRFLQVLDDNDLDAIVYPTLRQKPAIVGERQLGVTCSLAAHSGLPAFSLPAGFTNDGLPVGIELLGRLFGEGELLAIGYAYEQKTSPRRPPERTPSLVTDSLTREFRVDSDIVRGQLRLERPTQTLHYDLAFPALAPNELLGIRLARGSAGPVSALLGRESSAAAPIANEDLAALVAGNAELWVYTASAPAVPTTVRIVAVD